MVRQSSLTELESPFALSAEDRDRLSRRLETAVKRARRSGGETLATISLALPAGVDPSAVVCASRREGEAWFVFEQPDRGRAALAALGEVAHLRASGAERFAVVADRWRAMAGGGSPGGKRRRSGWGSDRVGRVRVRPRRG